MRKQQIAIFGSTGSIGTQALEIISNKPDLFSVEYLTAHKNYRLLAKQANQYNPRGLIISGKVDKKKFEGLLNYNPEYIGYGPDELEYIASEGNYDTLLNSLVGFAGFMSTYVALKNDKRVALANKESLVVGGKLITGLPGYTNGNLIPVDSEHSAMLQSLIGEDYSNIQKIIITASGGPFRDYSYEDLKSVKVEDALNHPNWNMGAKITVDSATMMNKGLEIIEAKWLFNLNADRIVPVIHPQSIIHSIVEYTDGSSKAQLGPPDMKVPILYSLTFPNRIDYPNKTLDYSEVIDMQFKPVNYELFPCLQLATESLKSGHFGPAILNAANEIAVERFLNREIRYIDIPKIIEAALSNIQSNTEMNPEALKEIDIETREYSQAYLR